MEPNDLTTALLEANLDDLFEHAPCGYIFTFPNGAFAKVNQTFLSWTKYERNALLHGKRFQDLLTVPGKIFYETHYTPLLRMHGFAHETAFDLRCNDGQILPVFVNSVQYRDSQGKPLLNRTTLFDASVRRAYERELQVARNKAEQALQLRDQFLSLAAHELRTPLAAMFGTIQLLQRRVERENSLPAKDQRAIQVVVNQTQRLNKMIQTLLDVSRIETGQLSIEHAPVDVCALLGRIVEEVNITLGEREIALHLSTPTAFITGDELRLEQVFQNLLQNALKYSAPMTPIAATVRRDEACVYVDVQDSGIGIPAASIPQLFERFYRASNVAEGTISGLGIGLFVVKEIVELHGGAISVASVEGQGSTFTVALPLARA